MSISIDIEGLDRIEEALTAAGESLIPSAAAGMKTGLALVERDAKKLVPAATGELRNSIRADVRELATSVTGEVGSHKEYAVYVEMGTGDVGRASGGNGSPVSKSYRTGGWFVPLGRSEVMIKDTIVEAGKNGFWTYGQPARPFLWPAWKANKEKVLAAIRAAIQGGLGG